MAGRPFPKGQSGNPAGRPKGARSKLGEAVLAALLSDFKHHGPAAIAATRETKPSAYLQAVVSLIARDHSNQTLADARAQAHSELAEAARRVNAMLGLDPGADLDEN